MGEESKRIGDIGEQTVANFLKLIGWEQTLRNFDIDCTNPGKHQHSTHGIDGYFHYASPVIANTLENILISIKNSNRPYNSTLVSDFKKDYNALTSAIECFKKSMIRNETNNSYSKINTVFDRGLLFKLNYREDINYNMIRRLCSIDVPNINIHDGIILIDNDRIDFIHNAISFVNNMYPNDDKQFLYYNTGLNGDEILKKSGKILPFQYLASSIIPFRVQINDKTTVLLCTKDNYTSNDLTKLLGLAKNIGINIQSQTIIAFPDYNELNHGQSVMSIKQMFNDDSTFTNGIKVTSYKQTVRI